MVLQGEDGDEHSDEDGADERRNEEQHHGLGQGDDGLELPVDDIYEGITLDNDLTSEG